ncbi:hypothetical protein A6U84_25915 (plasmid) [Agrobacterium sp. 13-2099-1-2]|uniref:hypothetical protein n=1 Tax=Agrobacterium sp. 13-2099-1-2 TaxID=1841651 RepID=UPI0008101025|nr:hypothetical protein [Agrobacterium sp. 13-2099-1-2]UZX45510.1 hypothetical protein A6U84_25915 [Agrobacterium sp. 13-2099-1-2]
MSKPSTAQIEFAKRYLTEDSTFNAHSAIQRLETFLEEIREVGPLLQPELDKQFAPSFFEFTSYYKVGFVTCLEWHAKSRLYDMFCFDPKTIKPEDIKQAVSNDKLVSMVYEGLNIPHLIAGSSSVSTRESYVGAIRRLFGAVGVREDALSAILGRKYSGITVGQVLEELYASRNDLVHEIGLQTIGHRNIRNFDSFDDVLQIGETLLRMITSIESELFNSAPANFPNKLALDLLPISEEETLAKLIRSMEKEIERALVEGAAEIVNLEDFQTQTQISKEALDKEFAFIDRLDIAGRQYFDTRPFWKATLLKQRVQYLTLLSRELC